MSVDYKSKYLLYKQKYLNLKKNNIKQTGGGFFCDLFDWFCSYEEFAKKMIRKEKQMLAEKEKELKTQLTKLKNNIAMDTVNCSGIGNRCNIDTYNDLISKLKKFCDYYIYTEVKDTDLYKLISQNKTKHICDYSCTQELKTNLIKINKFMQHFYDKYKINFI